MNDYNPIIFLKKKKSRYFINELKQKKVSIYLKPQYDIALKVYTKMKLLLFSDLDGTFMNHDDYSFDSLKEYISKLKNNHLIIFNTSKTFPEVIKIKKSLNINFPFIIENGACIFFPEDFKMKVFKNDNFFKHENYIGFPMTSKTFFWKKKIIEIRKIYNFKFKFYNEIDHEKLRKITQLKSEDVQDSKKRLFGEPVFWMDTKERLSKFNEEINSIGGKINIGGRFIHITDGYNKGLAVKKFFDLVDFQNFGNYISVSLGDSQNDVSMLEITDYSCIIKTQKKKKLDLKKKKKLYHSNDIAPNGWKESINFIINKEKINF